MTMKTLTRRQLLTRSLATPLAIGAASQLPMSLAHATEAQPNAIKHTFSLGEFEVSTLLAGTRSADDPQSIFGLNVPADEFAAVSAKNFIPADKNQFYFTPTVVRAGDNIILFDTGLNAVGITAPLAAAGIAPDDVTHIVLTHMHGDHIGGITTESGGLTFPNAQYITGAVEYDAWNKMDNDGFKAKVKSLADKMTFLDDGGSVTSGITAMQAFGHTPGHMVYRLESGGQQLVIAADSANHYVWSLAYPKWEVKFDMDKKAAAETRSNLFGMLAADKIPFIGYHMPFPGMGYVETREGNGFRYVPMSYQMMVG